MTPTPFLVPCLVQLRTQFNHEFPTRATGADGWIADSAHSSTSDHQPNAQGAVRAVDLTTALNRPGVVMADPVGIIIGRHQRGEDDRLEYLIYDRLIYSRSRGYKPVPYTGTSDPHTGHCHCSARHDGHGWNDTRPWGIEEIMIKDEFMDWMTEWAGKTVLTGGRSLGGTLNALVVVDKQGDPDNSQTSLVGRNALNQGIPNPIRGGKTPAWQLLVDVAAAVKLPPS